MDAPNPHGSGAWVTITRLRWQGVDDERNPNNEFVELTLDGRFAPESVALDKYRLTNNAGDTFYFPAGFHLSRVRPKVRIYTGRGTNTPAVLYWGKPRGVWRNRPATDCAILHFPNGNRYTFHYGKENTCPDPPAQVSLRGS